MRSGVRPVFVLGLQRSGTTWVANLLAAHPDVAAVAAPDHQGVHESVFFSHFATAFGPWEDATIRCRFFDAFLDSDYFLLTGLSAERARATAAVSYAAFFREIMDAFASARGARVWIEKSPHHTLIAESIAADYPDALFVCVERDTLSLLRSRLWAYGRRPQAYPRRALTICAACASNVFHRRAMRRFRSLGLAESVRIRFADLKRDPQTAIAPVLVALGLEAASALSPLYKANSSFSDAPSRLRALTWTDRVLATMAAALVAVAPQALLEALQRARASRRRRGFPAWVWRRREARVEGGPTT